ncbi:hypothetical protein [Streptomyces sp. FIT100]|uniref:hypothetical protein n=1 Tax=Streptomyces sp. FIT100 TaxID=2837956 RepID=UPI0021C6356D|nr:hypothetical protein [Streptomyces sp. FIT100]UUN30375.1 hypothetical protein KK483_31550 [Streptomyces sp. FIT100]
MRLRIMPVALLALLAATGCVSVSGHGSGAREPAAPPPGLTPAGEASASPLAPPATAPAPGQASARAELAKSDGAKSDGASSATPAAPAPRDGARPRPVPPRRDDVQAGPPARQTPPKPRPPRATRPDTGVRPPVRPRPHYDMGRLCNDSRGLADPSLTSLCRENFDR